MPEDKLKQDKTMTDPADVMAALLRAARRAHEIARATGTKEMEPNPEMFDDLDPAILGKLPPQAESEEQRRAARFP